MYNLRNSGLNLRTLQVTDYAKLVEDIQYNFIQLLNAPGFKGSPGATVVGPPGPSTRGSKWIFVSLTDFPTAQSVNDLSIEFINDLFQADPQGFAESLRIPDDSALVYGDTIVLPSGQIIQLITQPTGDTWIDTGISFAQVTTMTPAEVTRIVQELIGDAGDNDGMKYFTAVAKNASDASPAQNTQQSNDGAVDIVVSTSGPGAAMVKHKFYGPAETQISTDMFVMQIVGSVMRYHQLVQDTQTQKTNAYVPGVDDWASMAILQNSYANGLILGHKNSDTLYEFARMYKSSTTLFITSHNSPLPSEYSELRLQRTQAMVRATSEIELESAIVRLDTAQLISNMFNYVDDVLTLGTNNTKVVFDAQKGVFLDRIKNAKVLSTDADGKIVSVLTLGANLTAPSSSELVTTQLLADELDDIQDQLDDHQDILDQLLGADTDAFFQKRKYVTQQSPNADKNFDSHLEMGYTYFNINVSTIANNPVGNTEPADSASSRAYLKVYKSSPDASGQTVIEQEALILTYYYSAAGVPVYRKFTRTAIIYSAGNMQPFTDWVESPIGHGALSATDRIVIEDDVIKHTKSPDVLSVTGTSKQFINNIQVDEYGHLMSTPQTVDAGANGFFVPTGAVIPVASTIVPSGYLACRGQYVPAIHYPALYGVCGQTFGPYVENGNIIDLPPGSGIFTGSAKLSHIPAQRLFKLPDLRGIFIRGWNNLQYMSVIEEENRPDTFRTFGSEQASMIERHKHATLWGENTTESKWYPYGRIGNGTQWGINNVNQQFQVDKDNWIPLTNDGSPVSGQGTDNKPNPSGNVGNETRPRNIALLYVIKF